MTCPDCLTSTQRMHHGFRSGCKGCQARAASRGPQFFDSRTKGKQTTAYRQLIQTLGLTHEQVLEAHRIDITSKKDTQ